MEHYDKNFLGRNGFQWFIGVVEDRLDPQYTGRVRVRCLGYHTGNKITLPTSDLPWAQVVLPITSSGISGIGQTPLGLVEGSWVFGYFRDNACQEPVVIGSLPGKPAELPKPGEGFYDPTLTYPKIAGETDVNRLAVNEKDSDGEETNPHLSLWLRRESRITAIASADFNPVTTADGSDVAGSDGILWNQPAIDYNTRYPYNHVYESESGHVLEFDDTQDYERIHLRHRTGSAVEYTANGNVIDITARDHYKLTSSDSYNYTQGNTIHTINGYAKVYINKDGGINNHYDIQVGPNASINIQVDKGNINLVTVDGNINVNSGGDYNLKVQGNYTVAVEGNVSETVEGNKTSNTTGAVVHRGSTIDLNP